MRCKYFKETARHSRKYTVTDNMLHKETETVSYCVATVGDQRCDCEGDCNNCTFHASGVPDIEYQNKLNRSIDRVIDLLKYDRTSDSEDIINKLLEFKHKL